MNSHQFTDSILAGLALAYFCVVITFWICT
jgi:hypothetical protein